MTSKRIAIPLLAALALALGGCVSMPTGPSRAALPGSGKAFDQFRADDSSCRQYAVEYSGASPGQTQENAAVKSAVVGTVIGAAAGAAIGNTSHSTATGAGVGLLMGALSGAAAGNRSGYAVQRRYDDGYSQCMYAKGHRVAIQGNMAPARVAAPANPPPQPYYAPPPPQSPQAQGPYYAPPPPPGSAPPPPSAIVR